MNLFPPVKSLTLTEDLFGFSDDLKVKTNARSQKAWLELKKGVPSVRVEDSADLDFEIDPLMKSQAYGLEITPKKIKVIHGDEAGAFYAVKTLKQLMNKDKQWPCLIIKDEPDLEIRGYLLDISRDKIPTMTTLKRLIDRLADLKYNHFELYVEGFSFYYPSFAQLYTDETPITIAEFKTLEKYCDQRCIDFVPNHNGLGHMSAWLEKPQYKDMAAIEEGMFMWGAHRSASTLNPLDPRSLELVKTYTSDVLSVSQSPYFHLCMDEPYELGAGKTEAAAQTIGIGQMYLDYVLKMVDHVRSYGKTALIWGDVLNHYPELLPKLPKDLIFVDWGYDSDTPFHETLKRLASYQVTFMAAPGTSSWNSITGRTPDALENIRNACLFTKLNHGLGMLLTDWGDNGHLQPNTISDLPLIYGAFSAWSSEAGAYRKSIDYLNDVVYQDKQRMMGEVLADLGRYYRYQTEYHHNSTQIYDAIYSADQDAKHYLTSLKDHPYADPKRADVMLREFDLIKQRIKLAQIESPQGKADALELMDTIELLKTLILSFTIASPKLDPIQREKRLTALKKAWPIRLKRYRGHWLKNNRSGGLKDSTTGLEKVWHIIERL